MLGARGRLLWPIRLTFPTYSSDLYVQNNAGSCTWPAGQGGRNHEIWAFGPNGAGLVAASHWPAN
eukprot:7309688-Lingulodinium_polyedra.AAC.1